VNAQAKLCRYAGIDECAGVAAARGGRRPAAEEALGGSRSSRTLPQIAGFADHHYTVENTPSRGAPPRREELTPEADARIGRMFRRAIDSGSRFATPEQLINWGRVSL